MILGVLLWTFAGCAPSVTIDSVKNSAAPGTIQPVAFVIFEGNTGPAYTEPLRSSLKEELARRRISNRVRIIDGTEFDEKTALRRAAKGMRGLVLIMPVGGTSYYGALKQIRYDVQAFRVRGAQIDDGIKVWKGRVDTNSGAYEFQINERLDLFARELVARLVEQRVLEGSRPKQ